MNESLILIAVIVIPAFVFFIIYRILIYILNSLHISYKKALAITFFSMGVTFFPSLVIPTSDHLMIISFSSWEIGIHPIGFILPLLIITGSFFRTKPDYLFIFLGLIPICLISYLMTFPIVDRGVISPFPLYLFPPLMTAVLVSSNKSRLDEHRSLYAFSLGVLGIIIGADLAHLPALLSHSPVSMMQATLGGASGFDLIILSGILSVLFEKIISHLRSLYDQKNNSNANKQKIIT